MRVPVTICGPVWAHNRPALWYPEMVPMAGGYLGFAWTPAGRALIIEAKPHRRSLSEIIGHRQRWTLCVRDHATDELLTREVLTTE
jgi:hypothetical protein